MTDVEHRTGRHAEGGGLLAELTAIDGEVDAGARELEALVKLADLPDGASLSAARLRFSRALRRHLQFVDTAVMPYLRATADANVNESVGDYRRILNGYHEAAAHHVAAWPSTSVAADWSGYGRSVADMLSRLGRRVEAERRDIHPVLSGRDQRR